MKSSKGAPVAMLLIAAGMLLWQGTARADQITCRGSIVSTQGEGLVNRSFRFEVSDVSGPDANAILEKCRKIAQERQNKAARRNPGGAFRRSSQVELQCVQGTEKFDLRRTLQTAP